MSILVLEHQQGEDAGRLGQVLRDYNQRLDIRRLWNGDPVPADLDNIHAVISLGGSMNVSDAAHHPWMKPEMALLEEAHVRGMPVIGLCLGCQLLATALGGEVGPLDKHPDTNPSGCEIGWHEVKLAFPGTIDTMMNGMPWRHVQFHWHGQEVKKLPNDSAPLAGSAMCRVQAYRVGLRTYGFQFHFEVFRDDIERWSRRWEDQRLAAGIQHGRLMDQTKQNYAAFDRISRRLCDNIASYLIPAVPRMAS